MTRKLTITLATIVSVLGAACTGETASTTTSTAAEATTSSMAVTTTTSLAATTTTVEEAMEHDEGADGADPEITPEVAADLALIRSGSARYVNDLDAAVEDGFFIITKMIPDMGYHFLNPNVEGFDIGQPPILVYGRDGDDWELGAVEWVFSEEPAVPPMEDATHGLPLRRRSVRGDGQRRRVRRDPHRNRGRLHLLASRSRHLPCLGVDAQSRRALSRHQPSDDRPQRRLKARCARGLRYLVSGTWTRSHRQESDLGPGASGPLSAPSPGTRLDSAHEADPALD